MAPMFGNAAKAIVALLSAYRVLEQKALGFVASQLHAPLLEQRTREQAKVFAAMQKAATEKTNLYILSFGDPGMLVLA
jgi:hypothetical protein